ncbi:MAG: multidrug and toxin extrusion family efflux pump [Rhizobium sp.]|nr:multidrug and toxin extrusion family efflux pump [Rhizobium sp.]
MNSTDANNMFLHGSLPALFARTAAPIILIMTINGLYVVADAYFIGIYAGADALSAVSLIFPMMMMMVALQTLVSNGMSSILARHLGAGRREEARKTFTGAHLLVIGVIAFVYALFFTLGRAAIAEGAAGAPAVAANAELFMTIMVAFAPVTFFLSLNVDGLRCEGRLGFMTLVTISATLMNIAFNWLFMGGFGWGVAGSAFGSVLAQAICLLIVLAFRFRTSGVLKLARPGPVTEWKQMLALGAPSSLGFLGTSLISAAMITNIRLWESEHYVATIAAYGIVTRLLTVAYLPMLGISIAFQTIAGNNFGARLMDRTNASLKIALLVVTLHCGTVQLAAWLLAPQIGAMFSSDPLIVSETARILPWIAAVYVLCGLPIILSGYFQSIGDAAHAGILGLSRNYLFTMPLLLILPRLFGETGIWMAAPASDIAMVGLIAAVLGVNAMRRGWRFGVLQPV